MVSREHIYGVSELIHTTHSQPVPSPGQRIQIRRLYIHESYFLSNINFIFCSRSFKGHLFHETDKVTRHFSWNRHHCSEVREKNQHQKCNKFCWDGAQKSWDSFVGIFPWSSSCGGKGFVVLRKALGFSQGPQIPLTASSNFLWCVYALIRRTDNFLIMSRLCRAMIRTLGYVFISDSHSELQQWPW